MRRWLPLVCVAACAPAAATIHHTPTYPIAPARVFQVAMEAANDLYGLGVVDVPRLACVTKSFFTRTTMAHRGWAGERARGGWALEVVRQDGGAYGLAPTLEVGTDKLARAIDARVQALRR